MREISQREQDRLKALMGIKGKKIHFFFDYLKFKIEQAPTGHGSDLMPPNFLPACLPALETPGLLRILQKLF